jgi:hypothetical protein
LNDIATDLRECLEKALKENPENKLLLWLLGYTDEKPWPDKEPKK